MVQLASQSTLRSSSRKIARSSAPMVPDRVIAHCPAIRQRLQHLPPNHRGGRNRLPQRRTRRYAHPENPGGLMPEADTEGQRFAAATPQATPGFFLKGSHQLDWGMKNRLARVFDPRTSRTVMLALDHGYFQGPTTALDRTDLSIVPLLPSCSAFFSTG